MAAPASETVGSDAGTANPSAICANRFSGDHTSGNTCLDDPNFATICSFIDKFGETVKIGQIPFDELQQWLENTSEVPLPLVQLHLILLRRVFKTVSVDKWERSLAKFGHMYCSQDAWEIERFGYKKAKMQAKLSLLKNLLEAQFDFNIKFKAEVNKLQASDLRLTPLGRDTEGQVYWYQVDADANLRVYREDIDDETWEIVASTKEELVELISQLQRGEVRKPEVEEMLLLPEEDSNSKDGISPKEIILDTGKVEDDDSNELSEVSEDSQEKLEVKKVEPLVLRNVFSNMNKLQNNQGTVQDKVKEENGSSRTDNINENKPNIKLVFGKSKTTLDALFPPPAQNLPQDEDANKVPDKLSPTKLEETVSKLTAKCESISSASSVAPKTEIVEEVKDRTVENVLPVDQCIEPKSVEQFDNTTIIDKVAAGEEFTVSDCKKEDTSEPPIVNVAKSEPSSDSSDSVHQGAKTPADEEMSFETDLTKDQTSTLENTDKQLEVPEKIPVPEAASASKTTTVTNTKAEKNQNIDNKVIPISIKEEEVNITSQTDSIVTAESVLHSSENKHIDKGENPPSSIPLLPTPTFPSGTELQMPLTVEAKVPEIESTKVECKEVVEELATKTKAWVCGVEKQTIKVKESVTKEKTWVCGDGISTTEQKNPQRLEAAKVTQNDISLPTSTSEAPKEDKVQTENVHNDKGKMPAADKSSTDEYDNVGKKSSTPMEVSKTPNPPGKTTSSLVSDLYSDTSDNSQDAVPKDLCPAEAEKSEAKKTENPLQLKETTMSEDLKNEDSNKQDSTIGAEKASASESQTTIAQNVSVKSTASDPKEDVKKPEGDGRRNSEDLSNSGSTTTECENNVEKANSKSDPSPLSSTASKADDTASLRVPESKIKTSTTPTTDTDKVVEETVPSQTHESQVTELSEVTSGKRKAEEDIESSAKIPRMDDKIGCEIQKDALESSKVPFNPIVGETIEEEVMTITGEGSGAQNEGSNENSPAPLTAADVPGSQDGSVESDEEEESQDAFPTRGRGGRRGRRGRRGRPPGKPSTPRNKPATASTGSRGRGGGSRGQREVARLGVSLDSVEINGENERPVRASRRIAQIRLKEEDERRKLEEERLAQLKAAQMQKKAKQAEREDKRTSLPGSGKKGRKPGRKSLKEQFQHVPDYVPEDAESESDDESNEDDGSDEFSGKHGKKRKMRRGKNGKPLKKGGRPWATSSEEDEEAVEEEEEYHYEEEEEELVFKSDHEFSPESDIGEDGEAHPSRHARTAKQDKGDLFEEGNCSKCGKGDHPEWILLCDKCDKGWHASCLRPQLWYIPEGEWFCPPCQHNMLIENLSKNLVEYEGLLKRRENDILRKQRLAYVGISLDNVLPDKEKPEGLEEEQKNRSSHERKKPRRRILSDEEELSDEFINDRSDDGLSAASRTNSSDEDSDGPMYKLRARRTKKAFNFKEYDDMINSALRASDEEEMAEGEKEDEEDDGDTKLNGEEEETAHGGGGKNDAYIKHLEKQAQEEDETDEELLDEKERLRRRELKKGSSRKTKRRINDLDAYSDEEDSDDDFKASDAEDDEEEVGEDGESEWSGDKVDEDSDDSIAKRARKKERHGRLGRREKYSDKGLVRRSTRKRRSRISYDESDDEEEEDQNDKWESEEEETEPSASETNSESDDDTWGKKKKKALSVPKTSFFSAEKSGAGKGRGKGGVKRKKRKADDDGVDRAWNSARGKKQRDEPIERRTRGRNINFKDLLDSGESDDEGNVRPKRRPLSDSDEDSRSPSSSRKLAEEIRAENARKEKEYEESLAKKSAGETPPSGETEEPDKKISSIHESLTVAKLAESSVTNNESDASTAAIISHKSHPAPPPILPIVASNASPVSSPIAPSPASLPPNSSPMAIAPPASSPLIHPQLASTIGIPLSSSPVQPPHVSNMPTSVMSQALPSILSQSLATPQQSGLPKNAGDLPFPLAGSVLGLHLGLPSKLPGSSPVIPPSPIIPQVPAPATPEKKSKSRGSRGSRGSKSEKQAPTSAPMELESTLSKPTKASPPPPALTKSSSKKRGKESPTSITVPNPALLMAGGGVSLPDMLAQGMGVPSPVRSGHGGGSGPISPASPNLPPTSKKSSSKSSRGPANATQQTTPPPVSQNLSPSRPIDIDRVPNPALFQGNPGMRPFHPMWVRNPGPPPPGYGNAGSPVPSSIGKPPPLNTSPFSGQQGPPPRPGFPSPPPLRVPNPNTSPLQAFQQHFKRDGPLGGPMYRLPPGQPQLANILPPGMMPPHPGGAERFFVPPAAYGHPYGLLPPHAQGQHPQALFPYDYRPPDIPYKEEPPRTSSSSLPNPVSSASSSPPPTLPVGVPLSTKEDGPSEFGGLVSYFSSQRSEEDMDT